MLQIENVLATPIPVAETSGASPETYALLRSFPRTRQSRLGPCVCGDERKSTGSCAMRTPPRSRAKIRTAWKALIDGHNFVFANLWSGVKCVRACAQRQSRRASPRFVCVNRKAFDSAVADLNNSVHPVHRKGRQPVTPTDGAGAVPVGGVRRS
jgi:hypothetical protein